MDDYIRPHLSFNASSFIRWIVFGQTKIPDSINGGDSEEFDFVRLQPLIFHIQTLLGVGYRVLPCSYTWEFIAALSAFRQHLPAEFWGKTCPYSLLCGSTETLQMDEGFNGELEFKTLLKWKCEYKLFTRLAK